MTLARKTLSQFGLRSGLPRHPDSTTGSQNKLFRRHFSSLIATGGLKIRPGSTPKSTVLTNSAIMNDAAFMVASRAGFNPHPTSFTSQQPPKYTPAPKAAVVAPKLSLDLNDPRNKWVKEAMEVEHEAYEKLMTTYLPSLNTVVTYYKHRGNGLKVASFKTNDARREMCFEVCAPTYQFNDRGNTHIVEHSVLIRTRSHDTFNHFYLMVGGMYHSFLNALYYKNRTRYYFGSLNEEAFYQHADRFMDSFFRPAFLEDHDVLKQEGWHYKVTKQGDPLSNTRELGVNLHGRHVTFSGVVYNEMKKRAFATPHDVATSAVNHGLFVNTYKYDGGGNPEDIVELTQNELADFYRLYYGPETGVVYFHGPDDVRKRLDFVDDYVRRHNVGLAPDPKRGTYSHSASQKTLDLLRVREEFRETSTYTTKEFNAVDPAEDMLMMGWVLDPDFKGTGRYDLDTVDKVAFELLEHMMLGNPESTLRRALVDSKLGTRVVGPGLEQFYLAHDNQSFMFGLEGVRHTPETRQDNVKKFEVQVFKALAELADHGFKPEAVEAALSQLEFRNKQQYYKIKEHRQGYHPKGITLLSFLKPQVREGQDPVEALRFDELIAELRRRVHADAKYLPNLVRRHLLNNTTRVTVHLKAVESAKFEKEFHRQVAEQLEKRLGHLSVEEVDKMEEEYKQFKEKRESPHDAKAYEALPDVDPAKLAPEHKAAPTTMHKLSAEGISETDKVESTELSVTVVTTPCESNGVVYMDYAVTLDRLSVDDLRYLGLMAGMLKEAGTDKLSPEELSYVIDRNLGGLTFSSYFTTQTNNETYDDPAKGLGYLLVRAKCLRHKADAMVDVVNDVLKNANFGNAKKGAELAKRLVAELQYTLADSAHVSAFRRVASRFSPANYADELANGFDQLRFLKETLVPMAESDWPKVEARLNAMRDKMLGLGGVTVNLTGDAEALDAFLKNAPAFHQKLAATFAATPAAHAKTWVNEVLEGKLMENAEKNELLVMPLRNNFVGVGGRLFSATDKVSGSHAVALHYLMRSSLYRRTRAAGASYGVHVYLTHTGHVALISYADPSFLETLEVYKKVPDELRHAYEHLSDKAVRCYAAGKLATMNLELHPEERACEALKARLRGETKARSQAYREAVVETTREAFRELESKFRSSDDWLNVCSMVNRASAETAPAHFKRVYPY